MQEKRKFLRFGISVDMKYKIPHRGIEGLAHSSDVSREGVGCYIGERLPVGVRVLLEIDIPGEMIPIFARGEVVWCKELVVGKEANFNGGMKIIKIDSSDKSRLLEHGYNQWREKNRSR